MRFTRRRDQRGSALPGTSSVVVRGETLAAMARGRIVDSPRLVADEAPAEGVSSCPSAGAADGPTPWATCGKASASREARASWRRRSGSRPSQLVHPERITLVRWQSREQTFLFFKDRREPLKIGRYAPPGCASCSILDRLPSRTAGPPLPFRRARCARFVPESDLFVPAPDRFVPVGSPVRHFCRELQLQFCPLAHHTFIRLGLSLP